MQENRALTEEPGTPNAKGRVQESGRVGCQESDAGKVSPTSSDETGRLVFLGRATF